MLKLSEMALRPDFEIGPMLVSPSRRLIEGPGGQANLQPLTMQVFLLFVEAGGNVVTRNRLFDECWGGVVVGDDSLNQAIAKLRRVGAQVAPGLFEIETIPRTGYRLTGAILGFLNSEAAPGRLGETTGLPLSRRRLIGGGAATAAALGAGGLWWLNRDRPDPRFDELMERGRFALRLDEGDAAKYFEQAAAIEPESAAAWGLLAYALSSGGSMGAGAVAGPSAEIAQRAARTALAIDPNEPNALLAMTFIHSATLDRVSREGRYRRILSIDPDNTLVMLGLGQLLHGVGRCRESLAVVERALAIEPLAPGQYFRKAMSLWVLGRTADSDKVSDRAMQLWPSHRLARLARLMTYAFTGRTHAALAIVEEEEATPILLTREAASIWRISLAALENPTTSTIAAAREAVTEGSRSKRAIAAYGILFMSALGEIDTAFEIANGFLLSKGPVIVRPQPSSPAVPLNALSWRNTYGLFTPPTKAMRLDPRFRPLADGLGLTDYWRRRRVGPDAFLFKS